jgi:transposase InsO family protein
VTAGFRPAPGAEFYLHGQWHQMHEADIIEGSVTIVDADGVLTKMSLEDLVEHPGLSIRGQRPAPVDLVKYLPETERALVLRRIAHVNEVLTGYRSGEPNMALPGEPKPQYDPSRWLKDRYKAKAEELDHEAYALLGEKMSVGTMRRLARRIELGIAFEGAVDGRKHRRSPGRYRMPEVIAEITEDVVENQRGKSTVTKSTLWVEVQRRARLRFGKDWTEENLPSESTWRRWLRDRYTDSQLTGKARTRASATSAPDGGFSINVPTRPGQLVWMDTNNLDVLLKGTDIEDAVRGSLIVGLDAYSWSVCAVRVVEQAEKDIDISFAITDLGRPKQMMPGWPEEARWAFCGLPEQLIPVQGSAAEALGVSGMPFVHPEALGLDHGGPYKAQKTRDTAKRYGIDLLPARVRTGSDKAGVERFFGALRSMFLEKLPGYRGTDPSERGPNVEAEVEWTAQRLEDEISKWVVLVWQTHILDDVKPPWCPEGQWSPNALYLHGIETTGAMPRMMTAEDYFSVLDSGRYKVHSRGVKVLGLFYDDPVLDEHRNQPSSHPTKKWLVQYDRRDLRRVYFVDEETRERHLLKWRGASGEFPCFGERHIQALRRRLKADNLILDEHEIAEVLLTKILPQPDGDGGATREGKKANKAASRDARDAHLAASDAAKFGIAHPNNPDPSNSVDTSTGQPASNGPASNGPASNGPASNGPASNGQASGPIKEAVGTAARVGDRLGHAA